MSKYYKNWKSVGNNWDFYTESENPCLKEDRHHAEIVDITDGLVVEEQYMIMPDYKLDDHEILRQNNSVMDAFSNVERPKKYNLNDHYIF